MDNHQFFILLALILVAPHVSQTTANMAAIACLAAVLLIFGIDIWSSLLKGK